MFDLVFQYLVKAVEEEELQGEFARSRILNNKLCPVVTLLFVLCSVRWQWTKPSGSVEKPTEVMCFVISTIVINTFDKS